MSVKLGRSAGAKPVPFPSMADAPRRRGSDGGCFLYAIDNDVVISKRVTAAQ